MNLSSAGIYLFKVNNRRTRTMRKICSKLTRTRYSEQVNAGWVSENELRVRDLWNTNFESIFWSCEPKIRKISIFHKSFIPKYMINLKIISAGDISVSQSRVNRLSANPRKCSNTLKQFVGKLPTNCLIVSDHFVKVVFKGLN